MALNRFFLPVGGHGGVNVGRGGGFWEKGKKVGRKKDGTKCVGGG